MVRYGRITDSACRESRMLKRLTLEQERGATRQSEAAMARGEPALEHVEELYVSLRDGVQRYLISMGLDPERAMDATHEAFLRLYTALREREVIENHRSWVYRVAHNLALDGLRKRSREMSFERPHSEVLPAVARNAEEEMIQREKLEAFRNALRQLSPQQRQCLELRSQGLKYREIADILQLDISTVGEFLARGIRHMKKWSRCKT
jgi:RNA polymerase sigma-70 factor, ECF subfamily